MARSRRWTKHYRSRQITSFFDAWKSVVVSAFAELNRVSVFKHQLVELNDVHPARAAGLYAEAWLRAPHRLARESAPTPGDTTHCNRAVLSVVLILLAAPVLADSLNPDAAETLRKDHEPRWRKLVDGARLLAFDDFAGTNAFEQLTAARGLVHWLPANRHNWVGKSQPGASSVAAHERMHAVVDAYFDDAHRVEGLAGRRLGLLLRFPSFNLVEEPGQGDEAGYERRCELADVQWHRRFAEELRTRGFEAQLAAVLSTTAERESQALAAYRPDVRPALSAYAFVTFLAAGKDLGAAVRWIEGGGAVGACADVALRVLSAIARGSADVPPPELQHSTDATQARALAVCVTALEAAPDVDSEGGQP